MSFRSYAASLAGLASLLAIPGLATAASGPVSRWHTVTFEGVSLRVPASWPVVSFAADPSACPRLDVHAVYLGTPGPDPVCPAGLVGRSEAVMIGPIGRSGGGQRAAPSGQRGSAAGSAAAASQSVSRTITDQLPGAGVQVSISYRASRALADQIRSSIRVIRTGRARSAAGASAGASARRASARASRAVQQSVFTGSGFDSCAAPSAGVMTKWLASSYRAAGIYIGGVNRACAQANLTPSWLTGIVSQGWHYFPIYPGLQSSCVLASGDATISTAHAAAEGKAAADDAAARAASLGIGRGTPLSFDMEAYGPACNSQVTTFLSAWDAELHVRGYSAGIYESFSNIGALISAAGSITEPDVIYYADWDGKATTMSPYMPSNMWTNHARIHQYQGGHLETHGGATIDIDSDQLDVSLSGGTVPPARHPGYRVAVAINSNGTAEWFARSAGHALAHSWQQPVGSLTWSAIHTVGQSPTTIASNPSVVAQADGRLTVFARNGAGQVEHAWQQPGFPNDWEWGTPLPAPPQQVRSGTDPAAVLLPRHDVALYLTTADGSVAAATQQRPNQNARWTTWGDLGGNCASSPVPVVSGHDVDVFCVTAGRSAAVDRWNGRIWSGWTTLPGSPANLTGVPAVVVDGAGQVEFFAATTAGGLVDAWLAGAPGGNGKWTWGSPLAGPGSTSAAGTKVGGSPSAATWPSGNVVVYARLPHGQVGYVRHEGTAGSAGWSGWASIGTVPGGRVLGSPVGWLNSSGAAGAAVLDGKLNLAAASNSGSGWSAWSEIGDGF